MCRARGPGRGRPAAPRPGRLPIVIIIMIIRLLIPLLLLLLRSLMVIIRLLCINNDTITITDNFTMSKPKCIEYIDD